MTDQELIRALRCCVSIPRLDKCREECVFCKGHDMANCIPQMGQAVADRLSSLVEDLERVTRERDAAVEDLRVASIEGDMDCNWCAGQTDRTRCYNCSFANEWKWRGQKEDDMERLTERDKNGTAMAVCCGSECEYNYCCEASGFSECRGIDDIIDRLAAYEDTGLEPEEITALIENDHVKYHLLYEYQQLGTTDYLRELVQADLEMPVAEDEATKGGTRETDPV